MSKKLVSRLLLGLCLSSIYLTVFAVAVHQQQTSYILMTQAHTPQKLLNLIADESNSKHTLKTTAAIKPSQWRD